ncbi:MAG: TIM barrel protein [Puia sp.]
MKSALDKLDFHGAYFYFMIVLDQSRIDPTLKDYISALKGTNTILAPYITSSSIQYKAESPEGDAKVVKLLRELSKWAKREDLQVAIYPHFGYYVQRTGHALELVKQINRKNAGLSFNLCHWLATAPAEERNTLNPHLKELLPYLRMITICGANDVVTEKKFIWDDYILPLGTGNFDTYGLVAYVIKDLHFKGPVGVQCYGLKDDKIWMVKHTMDIWNSYKMRMVHSW